MKPRSINEIILSFKKRLTAAGSPLANFSPYSNIYAIFRSVASILSEQDTRLNNSIRESFITTASGSNLDRRAEDFGLYRLQGSKAGGSILIKSTSSGKLLKGTILTTSSRSLQFELVSSVNLKPGKEVLGKVISISDGPQYNLVQGTRLYSISNPNLEITTGYSRDSLNGRALGSIEGGLLTESDSSFRDRILNTLRKKDGYVGTASSIKEQVLKLPFVTKVFISNHKPVTGYFTVYVDNRDSKDLNYIYRFIESIKPVGTLFLLKPLILKPVAISIECEGGNTEVKFALSHATVNYLNSLSLGESLNLSDLSSVLSSIHTRAKITSPVTDISPGKESVIAASSIKVLV